MARDVHVSGGGGGGGASAFDYDAGFFRAYRSESSANINLSGMYKTSDGTSASTVVDDEGYFFQLSPHVDDALTEFLDTDGWLGGTPVTSSYWGIDFPADTYLTLPPGRYQWYTFYRYRSTVPAAPSDSNAAVPLWDTVEDPYLGSGNLEDFYSHFSGIDNVYAAMSPVPFLAQGFAQASAQGAFVVSNTQTEAQYFPYLWCPQIVETQRIFSFSLYLWKVA